MSKSLIKKVPYEILKINPELLSEMMGYALQDDLNDPISKSIHNALKDGENAFDLRGGYVMVDHIKIDFESYTISSGKIVFNTNKIITVKLKGAEQAAIFMCTAGEKISAMINKYFSIGDLMNGYALDTLANIAVDAAMDHIQYQLQNEMKAQSLKITNRFSPGYCDWELSEQEKIFSLFPASRLGVSLSSSYLMSPVKTVSGLIGIGKQVKYINNTCSLCNNKSCIYRSRKAGSINTEG